VTPTAGQYDDYATEYAASVAMREQGGVERDLFGILEVPGVGQDTLHPSS
jgi:hypothetical protein